MIRCLRGVALHWGVLALITLLACGCSQKQVYEAVQHNQQQRCLTIPEGARDDCMAQSSMSYDAYQQALEDTEKPETPRDRET